MTLHDLSQSRNLSKEKQRLMQLPNKSFKHFYHLIFGLSLTLYVCLERSFILIKRSIWYLQLILFELEINSSLMTSLMIESVIQRYTGGRMIREFIILLVSLLTQQNNLWRMSFMTNSWVKSRSKTLELEILKRFSSFSLSMMKDAKWPLSLIWTLEEV